MFFKKIDFSKYEPTDQDTLRACFDELELSGYDILEKETPSTEISIKMEV